MIVNATILYRADIIKPGHRKSEECLLKTVVPIRLQEVRPSVAVRMTDNTENYGKNGIPISPHLHHGKGAFEWYGHNGSLLGSYQVVLGQNSRKLEAADGETSEMAMLKYALSAGQPGATEFELAADFSDLHPFLSHEAILGQGGPWVTLPIYDETIETRSRSFPIPDGRDIAIAHAQMLSRRVLIHADTQQLLTPSIGPVILGGTRPLRALPYVAQNFSPEGLPAHLFSAREMGAAQEFNAEVFRGLPEVEPLQTIDVLDRDMVTWDSAAASLAAIAGQAGMWTSNVPDIIKGAQAMLGIIGGLSPPPGYSSVLLAWADINNDEAAACRPLFRDIRAPSRQALEIAHGITSAAERGLLERAMNFVDWHGNAGREVNVTALLKLQLLLRRSRHLDLDMDANAMRYSGLRPGNA